jgi:hypothetical protein
MGSSQHEDSDPIGTGRNGKKELSRSSRAPGTQLVFFVNDEDAGGWTRVDGKVVDADDAVHYNTTKYPTKHMR